jgi:1-acyl-sn-glycerol-3-phosphate acyltransferase
MGLGETLKGIAATARISASTVAEAALGRSPDMKVYDDRLSWWAHKVLRDADVDLRVSGSEHAGDGTEPLIVMSNHQSLYDIPVIYCSVPGRVRMVAKKELFAVPLWGRAMRIAGMICLDRSDRGAAIESLREGSSMLRDGTRVWIAPEGTRSETGDLGPFKSGGFRMALDTGYRILPVAIDGTRHVLPARTAVVKCGKHVDVAILPPIDPKAFGVDRRKDLMREVRKTIATALGQPVGDDAAAPRLSDP